MPAYGWGYAPGYGPGYWLGGPGSGSGSINFDFTTGTLPPGITFTRASIGTYNSSGNILTTATSNVARFNYVAGVANLLIEPAATNLLLQSNNFSTTWAPQAANVVASQFISPDGTNNGWSLNSTDVAGNGWISQSPTFSAVPYTMSIWANQVTAGCALQFYVGLVASGGISIPILARYSATKTPAAGVKQTIINIIPTPGTISIYGAQLETGSVMTSYIPTTTVAVTRAADSAVFTIPAGVNALKYTFDDGSTQVVTVTPGSYTIPTNLNRANIKSIQSVFALDFTGGSLPAGVTFTRPSIGTYNSSGNILTTASNDVARFNYVSGVANLLIEPSATNLVLNSNDFLNASWTPTGPPVITPNQFISPDGTNNGWSVAFGTGGNSLIKQVGQITFTNTLYTASIWAMRLVAAGNLRFTIGLIATGTISPTTSLVRVSVAATPAAGVGDFTVQMLGGTGTTNGLYGVQLEVGSIVTSYIPTTGSFVTRAADSAVFTIPAGIWILTYTFDDNSTQAVTVTPGSVYTIPTNLNRPNIKSIVGSTGFDFTTGTLPPGITFTRASIGTYFNNAGILITAGNNVARFNYIAGVANLLIEGSATNLLLQSNNFSNASWLTSASPVITAAQFVSPDGTNNGWSITAGTGNAFFYQSGVPYSNIPYVMSIWSKFIAGTTDIAVQMGGLSPGTLGLTAALARLFATITTPAGASLALLQLAGATGTDGIYGAQVEAGSKPTSYIPTTTAPVTRAADSATFTIPAGIGHLTFTFDDNTTQTVVVSAGSYTIPATLNRPNLKSIVGSA